MHPSCPYTQVSYATWRLQVLKRLFAGTSHPGDPRCSLQPQRHSQGDNQTRSFHASTRHKRKWIKDLKRTAKHKMVQLELSEPTRLDDAPAAQNYKNPSSIQSRSKAEWNPYSENSLGELQDLVADLRVMAKEAARKSGDDAEDNVPFEFGSQVYARKKPGQPESPLERRLPWDREKKLQTHEVEVDKKLQDNVWAQMLASPLRLDRATKARLPKDLMLGFGVIKNPKNEKDYVLPIELSDLEALRKELKQTSSIDETTHTKDEDPMGGLPQYHPRRGTRIPMQPNKLLIQAMTEDFNFIKPSKDGSTSTINTNSAKVSAALVPFRWRYKQAEMEAFQRTRQNFNEALGRQPDADEPNMAERARFDKLQWQSDMPERLGQILMERVLIVLEALGRGNVSGRAIRARRVLALTVPEDAKFYSDYKGRIASSKGADAADTGLDDGGQQVQHDPLADWISGAFCIHVGDQGHLLRISNEQQQDADAQVNPASSDLGQFSSRNLIPPTITIDETFRLPVFNLRSLLDTEHAQRLARILKESKIFTPEFWEKFARTRTKTQSDTNTSFNANIGSAGPLPETAIPSSPLDAGEQVLSSIVTPEIDAALSEPQPGLGAQNTSSSSSSSRNKPAARAEPLPSSANPEPQEPYLILIKPQAKHSSALLREIWQLWRYQGGKKALDQHQ